MQNRDTDKIVGTYKQFIQLRKWLLFHNEELLHCLVERKKGVINLGEKYLIARFSPVEGDWMLENKAPFWVTEQILENRELKDEISRD